RLLLPLLTPSVSRPPVTTLSPYTTLFRSPDEITVAGETILNKEWIEKLPLDGIRDIIPVAGGDVNDAYRVETDDGPAFLLVQPRSEEHTSELQSRFDLVCRLLLEKKRHRL